MRLSELQSALREHPGVRDVAIISREVIPGEKKLIAYVVPETNCWEHVLSDTGEERKRLQKWRKTFDLMQFGKEAAASAVAFNIAGWNSSYTRQPIPAEEMREQSGLNSTKRTSPLCPEKLFKSVAFATSQREMVPS